VLHCMQAHAEALHTGGGCAGLLVELERLMLTSGTASVSMNTFLDNAPEFQAAVGAASALEAMSSRLYNDDVSMHLASSKVALWQHFQLRAFQTG
jgi:hypothetical protein